MIKKKVPSGKIILHDRKERPAMAKCANCKSPLHGMPRRNVSGSKKLSQSERRPQRPYGGYLCSNCTREIFREKARM